MKTVNDPRKLAQILLKTGKIDRDGFDHIISRVADEERAAGAAGKKGKLRGTAGSDAIGFIGGLKVKQKDAASKTITDEDVVKSLATVYNIQYKKLDPLDLDADIVTKTIPKPFALKHMILPLYLRDGSLYVAITDPESNETIEGLARVTGKKITPTLATPADVQRLIYEFFGFRFSVTKAEEQISGGRVDISNLEQLSKIARPDLIESNDEHIKNAVDYLFNYAFEMRASDIHIEPKRDSSRVRFRIDGVLNDVYKIPKAVHQAVASRVKMLGRMDIAEKRRPQDGRIRVEHGDAFSEIRVSTMPTAFGEKLVMRVLEPEMLLRDMESLGFFSDDQIKFERLLNHPYGIILVTGPTGSGKTTTLYTALNFLSTSDKNVITVEDPIETICEKFNQVAVQPAIGLTFASSIRTILRQDPDIIMVGEIRDNDTAENAIQAALTGHLVLSTLHTNDTTSSITRLLDLGVKPFLINSAVAGIVAQRLVRIICPHCITSYEVPAKKLQQFGVQISGDSVTLKEGKGCENCRFTGYLGRTGVYEVLEIDGEIRRMIQNNVGAMEIRKYALDHGMTTIRESAARKMLGGVTTMQEFLQLGYQLE